MAAKLAAPLRFAGRQRPRYRFENEGGPRHHPQEAEAPEEPQGNGVVVVGNAQVEVTQHVLVHEVKPVPATDVAVCGQWDLPVVVDEVEGCRVALRGVGEAGEDVPWDDDEQEGFEGGDRVKFAQSMQTAAEAAGEEQIDGDDRYWEDDAD